MADSWQETSRSGGIQRDQHTYATQIVGVMLPGDIGSTTKLPTVGKLMNGSGSATDWTTAPTTEAHALSAYIVQNIRIDKTSQAGRAFTYSIATIVKGA